MLFRSMTPLMLLVTLAFLCGCSAVGKAPPETDLQAKQMSPPEDMALVYIVRPTTLGTAVKFKVTCNGEHLGSTGGSRFIYAVLEPGRYLFASKAENTSELVIMLEPNKTYYLEQKVKMGLMKARNDLERISDEEGRKKLEKCSLSDDMTAISR